MLPLPPILSTTTHGGTRPSLWLAPSRSKREGWSRYLGCNWIATSHTQVQEVLRGAAAMAGGLLKEAHPVVRNPSTRNLDQHFIVLIRWKGFDLGLETKIGSLLAKQLITLEPTLPKWSAGCPEPSAPSLMSLVTLVWRTQGGSEPP